VHAHAGHARIVCGKVGTTISVGMREWPCWKAVRAWSRIREQRTFAKKASLQRRIKPPSQPSFASTCTTGCALFVYAAMLNDDGTRREETLSELKRVPLS